MQQKQLKFLFYWLWAWPLLGVIVLFWNAFFPSAFRNCESVLFVPGLIGTTAAGWASLRTKDQRFFPQLGAATMTFLVGAARFWTSGY